MNQYVNTEGMEAAIEGIQAQIAAIESTVGGFDATCSSLAGTTFPIKDSIESSLKNVVNSYSANIVPEIEKMNKLVEAVKQKYITSLNSTGN